MKKHYLAYLHSIWFSHRKLQKIFLHSTNYKEVFENINDTYLVSVWFSLKQRESILAKYKTLDASLIDTKIRNHEVEIITFHDAAYPKLLREITNPPYLLYIQWHISHAPSLAVIGSRCISSYGKRSIEKIVSEISNSFVIVSGGAMWCDTHAHKQALKQNNSTYVIVGTGIDVTYPAENRQLYQDIAKNKGAIISIFPFGETGNPYNFPARNEIISGMSLGTLVIEAAEKSGTWITAKLALEQWRDVFAIPGEIDKKNSIGCNAMIQRWEAKMVLEIDHIFEEYPFLKHTSTSGRKIQLDPIQEEICSIVAIEPLNADTIAYRTNRPLSTIISQLSLLEMKHVIKKNIIWQYELLPC